MNYDFQIQSTEGKPNNWELGSWEAQVANIVTVTNGSNKIQKLSGSGMKAGGFVTVNQRIRTKPSQFYQVS